MIWALQGAAWAPALRGSLPSARKHPSALLHCNCSTSAASRPGSSAPSNDGSGPVQRGVQALLCCAPGPQQPAAAPPERGSARQPQQQAPGGDGRRRRHERGEWQRWGLGQLRTRVACAATALSLCNSPCSAACLPEPLRASASPPSGRTRTCRQAAAAAAIAAALAPANSGHACPACCTAGGDDPPPAAARRGGSELRACGLQGPPGRCVQQLPAPACNSRACPLAATGDGMWQAARLQGLAPRLPSADSCRRLCMRCAPAMLPQPTPTACCPCPGHGPALLTTLLLLLPPPLLLLLLGPSLLLQTLQRRTSRATSWRRLCGTRRWRSTAGGEYFVCRFLACRAFRAPPCLRAALRASMGARRSGVQLRMSCQWGAALLPALLGALCLARLVRPSAAARAVSSLRRPALPPLLLPPCCCRVRLPSGVSERCHAAVPL